MNKRILFYGVVIIQVLFLLGMILFKQSTLWYGQTVHLKPIPVDPTDFIRGDFVNLRYEISMLQSGLFKEEIGQGDSVYVSLKQNGEFWDAKFASRFEKEEPYLKGIVEDLYTIETYVITDSSTGKNHEYDQRIYDSEFYMDQRMRIGDRVQFDKMENGQINWVSKCADCTANEYQKIGMVSNVIPKGSEIAINYPIQSYFIPKGTGNAPELMNVSDMLVEVKVLHGDAIVTKLLHKGKEIAFKPNY